MSSPTPEKKNASIASTIKPQRKIFPSLKSRHLQAKNQALSLTVLFSKKAHHSWVATPFCPKQHQGKAFRLHSIQHTLSGRPKVSFKKNTSLHHAPFPSSLFSQKKTSKLSPSTPTLHKAFPSFCRNKSHHIQQAAPTEDSFFLFQA
ncbi:hypothetical protein SAMN02745702_00007 [Desulfobaculum bizertense DSM 18034]|uniref:Uncharacterized protein n=1 Tax=Desulfobaculum bizertense DSM 18034 TaxID=1121442 RepID=A0A1T4VCP7_9BACT|nr:hypothetical protein SAMN02745702_00007 [Desulfobaculum bizertense DSM 18034]